MSSVHVLVPAGIDDPTEPSGGNGYDRRLIDGLPAAGWTVHEHLVAGDLAGVVASLPDGALVLVDGLLAVAAPAPLAAQAQRLRFVVLAHMAFDEPGEGQVLTAAAAVVTTSRWTRQRLVERHGLDPAAVHVAEPGVDPARLAPGTAGGGALVCVAAVTPLKGHDVLLDALAHNRDLPLRCVCVGSLTRDPDFVGRLRRQIQAGGLADRLGLVGPRAGADLDAAYLAADALVLASRAESYGMVVTEALARGLPVIASAVGGVAQTLGGDDLDRPGLLVPPDDPAALAAALRHWATDPGLRRTLRAAAAVRRAALPGWSRTAELVAGVLAGMA